VDAIANQISAVANSIIYFRTLTIKKLFIFVTNAGNPFVLSENSYPNITKITNPVAA